MITIATNKYYSLKIDKNNNRAFLSINGFWRNTDEVSAYLSDWKTAVNELSPNFTLLTDARDMKIHPSDVRELHKKAQELIESAGVKKVAELQNESITEMQLDGVSRESGIPKQNFTDKHKAIKWLNS